MAITNKRNIWLYSSEGNVAPAKLNLKIAASQGTFIPGTLFYMSTSGTLKKSDTADGTGDLYQYMALQEVTSELAANTEIPVIRITEDQIFAVYLENNTADLAATQALIGDQYGLTIATAAPIGYVTVDINNGNACVEVVNIMPNVEPSKNTTSDSPGIALVRFLDTVLHGTRA